MNRLFVMYVVVLMSFWGQAADWPQWRGPGRDGVSDEEGLLERWNAGDPRTVWRVETEGEGYAAVSVADGRVYVTGSVGEGKIRDGYLYALDAETGKELWSVKYGSEWGRNYPMSRCTPTLVDQHAYVYSGMGVAACVDLKVAKLRWQVDVMKAVAGKNVRWGIAESPLVADGLMFCHPGGDDAAVVALDAETGAIRWRSKGLSEKSAYASPMIADLIGGKTLLTQTEHHIVGLDPETGSLRWKVPHRNRYGVHPNTPVVLSKEEFVVSSGYRYGSELIRVSDGKAEKVWHQKDLACHFQGIIEVKGNVVGSGGKSLMALEPETGAVVWEVKDVRKAAIVAAGELVFAYDSRGGKVFLVKATDKSAEVRGHFSVAEGKGPHWAHPVVANGKLYIRHGKALLCYKVTTSAL